MKPSLRHILSRVLFSLVILAPTAAVADMESKTAQDTVYYTASAGDTLPSIALRFGVGLSDVKEWNDLDSLHVKPGERLVVKTEAEETTKKKKRKALPVIHVIRRGDTFEDIARQYGVSIKQVRRWNRRLNPRRLQIGQRIRLYIPGRDGKSVSWGRANRGRLYNGIALESTEAFEVRSVARAYGTERVVQMLEAAAADVRAHWNDAPKLVVGDLSYKRGGRMRPHKSHQSGRDADLSFYHRGNVQTDQFVAVDEETLDTVKTWHLFKTLIDTQQVEYIFVNYPLQKPLYEYARSIGYSKAELEDILQYPHGRRARNGIIRHARGHDDHFHIRFTCGPDDKHCD